jgi:hypothetical protein
MKKVLIISYYFPPMGMGGVQRALKFAKYLPSFGWQPIILTVKDVDYFAKDYTLLEELSNDTKIIRTGSFDPLRISYLLKKGKSSESKDYTTKKARIQAWIFFPDNKIGWLPFALNKAIRLVKKENIDIIFSTSPPPTSHLIGCLLKKVTKKPWVADFRDPWIGLRYQTFPTLLHKKLKEGLEKSIVKNADAIITINSKLSKRMRQLSSGVRRVETITNGFDQQDFKSFPAKTDNAFTILHSGTLSSDHNPLPFFIALYNLIQKGRVDSLKIKVLHCGLSLGINLEGLIEKYKLGEVFLSLGYLPHLQSIEKFPQADLLLLTTASQPQAEFITTGKLFEYLAARKPILAIVPKESDAAQIVQASNSGTIIAPQEIKQIEEAIFYYYDRYYRNEIDFQADEKMISQFERKHLTSKLAQIFDELI